MKPSSKRILSILTSTLFLVGFLAVFSYLIQPAYEEISDLRGEITVRDDLVREYENSLAKVKQILADNQEVIRLQSKIAQILPSERDVPEVVNQITGLAALGRQNINFLSVQQFPIRPSTNPNLVKSLGVLRINFRLSGAYEDFRSFLERMETNVYLMDLINLKIDPAERTGTGELRLSYTINADTYYQAE